MCHRSEPCLTSEFRVFPAQSTGSIQSVSCTWFGLANVICAVWRQSLPVPWPSLPCATPASPSCAQLIAISFALCRSTAGTWPQPSPSTRAVPRKWLTWGFHALFAVACHQFVTWQPYAPELTAPQLCWKIGEPSGGSVLVLLWPSEAYSTQTSSSVGFISYAKSSIYFYRRETRTVVS